MWLPILAPKYIHYFLSNQKRQNVWNIFTKKTHLLYVQAISCCLQNDAFYPKNSLHLTGIGHVLPISARRWKRLVEYKCQKIRYHVYVEKTKLRKKLEKVDIRLENCKLLALKKYGFDKHKYVYTNHSY